MGQLAGKGAERTVRGSSALPPAKPRLRVGRRKKGHWCGGEQKHCRTLKRVGAPARPGDPRLLDGGLQHPSGSGDGALQRELTSAVPFKPCSPMSRVLHVL